MNCGNIGVTGGVREISNHMKLSNLEPIADVRSTMLVNTLSGGVMSGSNPELPTHPTPDLKSPVSSGGKNAF